MSLNKYSHQYKLHYIKMCYMDVGFDYMALENSDPQFTRLILIFFISKL